MIKMLRGIFGALKSCVQYCVGVKSRLLCVSFCTVFKTVTVADIFYHMLAH